ncbi:MAG TPA: TetR/AcrR family transcriptional regulator [Bacteroidales bacterium]|nr:TetR/AcrR family transcriptional regulator [Bacteroidales bacterium]HPS15909.1 TetR/AcrR family transcriptional regulator [Bacteroidales bacterium]
MNTSDKSTEKIILEAAKKVFLLKGFDGARMQEIADEAKMNKALLHYYFRSKDKLFDAISKEAFEQFFPRVAEIVNNEKTIFEKIESFVDIYITMLLQNPHLPVFVLHEVNRNPERFIKIIKHSGVNPEYFGMMIQKEVEKGNIRPVNPIHLLINILGMCIFPFIGKPILQGFIFNNDSNAYQQFISERKEEVKRFVINSIKK